MERVLRETWQILELARREGIAEMSREPITGLDKQN
jgi:hypothetical protein